MSIVRTSGLALAIVGLLCIVGSAQAASTTLQALIDGDTITSDNIEFFDFSYSPNTNAPAASDVTVSTVANGLKFSVPLLVITGDDDIIDFDVEFRAKKPGHEFVAASLESVIGQEATGLVEIIEDIDTTGGSGLADLSNFATSNVLKNSDSTTFDATEIIRVTKDIGLSAGDDGFADLSDFTQKFRTRVVPTPTAALAGVTLVGLLGLRRRRDA